MWHCSDSRVDSASRAFEGQTNSIRFVTSLIMSEEEYESSSDDEEDDDYVPDEEELNSEDEELREEAEEKRKSKEGNKKGQRRKRHKGGIKLDEEDDDLEENEEDEEEEQNFDEEQERLVAMKEEEKKKAKMDDLWASFKKDTAAARPKTTAQNTAKATSSLGASPSRLLNKQRAKKVMITKTFDFAGEEVKITKTVDADSKEAKKAQKDDEQPSTKPEPGPSLGVKRSGGIGSIIGTLGKKPKISTLEKSKLDWEHFKEEKGISDELQHHNKDGYLEKQAFLSRTDWNSFEREKALRDIMRKNTT